MDDSDWCGGRRASGNRTVSTSHRALSSDLDYHGISAAVTVTVVDNDGAGVSAIASNSSTAVTEAAGAGRTDTYTVVLNTRPTGNVRIAVLSSDEGAATVSPASLTFTTTNWSTMETVTVTGMDDNVDQGNRSVIITPTATSLSPYPTALPSSPPWSWASGKTVGIRNPALAWIQVPAFSGRLQSGASAGH